MNPDTNKLEPVFKLDADKPHENIPSMLRRLDDAVDKVEARAGQLYRADGTPVPDHWSVFTVGEEVVIKNYTFRVAYIGEGNVLFEPVGPVLVKP